MSTTIELLKPFAGLKVGDITDTLSDGVCRTLIDEGAAKPSTEIAKIASEWRAESQRQHEDFKTEMRGLIASDRKGNPPGGKELNDALNLDPNTIGKPVFEEGKKHFSDVLRCIHAVGAKGAPPEIVEFASNRLRHVYSDEKAEYKINPQTGKMDSIVTRHLDDGGTEIITRTGTDSLGGGATYGFTVKPNWLGDLFRIAREREVFASSCRAIPVVQGVETKYPALEQYQPPTVVNGLPQPAFVGGITLAYKGETAARVESDSATDEIDFKIVDLTGATSFSRDYIVDNYIAMDSVVTGLFGDAMAWMEDWVMLRGNAVGTIQGVFNCNALIQIARSNANKIASDDIAAMLAQLAGQCERNARWIAHRSTIPQLFILNNKAGTPVFQPNALIMQSDPLSIMSQGESDGRTFKSGGTLVGYPIMFTEKVPQLGTPGDFNLFDPLQFGLAERLGLEVGVSEHFYFSTDKIAFRFKKRHDGRSLWRAPYQDASAVTTGGTPWSVSPFIQLK